MRGKIIKVKGVRALIALLLGGGLIGERKRRQNDVAELKAGHRRHHPGYPTP